MKKLFFMLFWLPVLNAMSEPSSPLRNSKISPQELATALSVRLFDKQDNEVISMFSQILTKDKQGNKVLVEMRYKMCRILEQERLQCGDTH
jgi:hypothetical protein